MLHIHRSTSTLVLLAAVAACREGAPASPVWEPPAEDLAFVSPIVTAEDLVDHASPVDSAGGPAAVGMDEGGEGFCTEDVSPECLVALYGEEGMAAIVGLMESGEPAAGIFNAWTVVGFAPSPIPDHAYSWGHHEYTGNKGRVETTATVSDADGAYLGSQTGVNEQYNMFLFDFGRTKSIIAKAHVGIDTDCGLSVRGSSRHSAWWEWFLGGPAPEWGADLRSTQASSVSLDSCPPPEKEKDSTSGGPGGDGDMSDWDEILLLCTYLIEYDIYTGEILDSYLLFCAVLEGGV